MALPRPETATQRYKIKQEIKNVKICRRPVYRAAVLCYSMLKITYGYI